jgi:uncharacterized membrane protein
MGAALGLPWWQSYLISVAGNLLPVPFILLFINAILRWMSNSKVKFFNKVANWLFAKAEKNRAKIEKYAFWGVALFVAVPLPVTGAWTGSLVAALFDLRMKHALPAIFLGVITAGLIMSVVSCGVNVLI